ncbi:MAG TPA: metal ABC transporter substrate-binding protein [Candidatus Hydrogenedentes bacterium]|nr:metal ABC transporter substrate-binding protein [Candidatus Hydrogenedentota bacterium]HPG67507.1 metal ABC transporter substrate-binding protein [Candidatus Hydrogenedentota bacterium]
MVRHCLAAACLVVALAIPAFTSCAKAPSMELVAGTADLRDVVATLTGDPAGVQGLIPPAMCPGHYDIRPSDIQRVKHATALLIHPWQQDMPNVRRVVETAQVDPARIRVVPVEGTLMVPEVRLQAVEALVPILGAIVPAKAGAIQQRAMQLSAEIQRIANAQRARLEVAPIHGAAAVCNEMQVPLAQWAGFSIAATFGRSEGLSAAQVAEVIDRARRAGAILVIDNLQSGDTQVGAMVAREIGVPHVVLSNFTGGLPGADSWSETIGENVRRLVESLPTGQETDDGSHH